VRVTIVLEPSDAYRSSNCKRRHVRGANRTHSPAYHGRGEAPERTNLPKRGVAEVLTDRFVRLNTGPIIENRSVPIGLLLTRWIAAVWPAPLKWLVVSGMTNELIGLAAAGEANVLMGLEAAGDVTGELNRSEAGETELLAAGLDTGL
jgi:hypothetical protein